MNKLEITEMLDAIVTYYPGSFTVKPEAYKATVEAWYLFLKDVNKEFVMKNLADHVRTERFPPSIADLLKIPAEDKYENGRRAIPNTEQTLLMLEEYKNRKVASPEVRERELAKMREFLKEGRKTND